MGSCGLECRNAPLDGEGCVGCLFRATDANKSANDVAEGSDGSLGCD